jgi:thiamine-phosphate pyrophosphorylase
MKPILCLVTDRIAASGDLLEWVAAAVGAGVDWVQIRERKFEGTDLHAHAEAIANGARLAAVEHGREVAIFVNRRTDVAMVLNAEGVQLGFDSMDATTARRLLGPEAQIGVSLHDPDEISAIDPAANHLQLAPIFAPLSKPSSRPPLGIKAITAAAQYEIPVIAQGGIDATNAAAVIEAGAAGIAVTGAVLSSTDPIAATRALRAALDSASR